MTNEEYRIQYAGQPDREDCMMGIVPEEVSNTGAAEQKTVAVAEFITMTSYLFKHYRLAMYSYLNACLRNGTLATTVGFRFQDRVINKEVCSFQNVTYWRVDRENFIADVEVNLCLTTVFGKREWKGFLSLWFNAEESFSCSIEYLAPIEQMDNQGLTMLSPFLVPYYSSKQLDDEAEAIWKDYFPEGLEHLDTKNAYELAERMGLSIRYVSIFRHRGVDSILFFEEGELTELDEVKYGPAQENLAETVTIPANTIVVNLNRIKRDYSPFHIYHECIHFEEHYLAYRLQKLQSNDVRKIKTQQIVIGAGEKVTDPIFWMEKQANRGAYGLMMPRTKMQSMVCRALEKTTGGRHSGDRYQKIGIELAKELHLPHFRIRARMIQLGHLAAKGALNYVNHRMIEPFAFDTDKWTDERLTFVIDKDTVGTIRSRNPDFREIVESEKSVYADGHMVRNEPRFLEEGINGKKLSAWANAHVDQCCLRFTRHFVQKNVGQYVFGRMNYDADYVTQTMFYLEDIMNTDVKDELMAEKKLREEFPETFKGAFDFVRKRNRIDMEDMAEKMNLTLRSLQRYLADPDRRVTLDFVVIFALLLKVPDWLTDLLLDRAHRRLTDSDPRHRALRWILRTQWMDGVENANAFLQKKGFEPLTIA